MFDDYNDLEIIHDMNYGKLAYKDLPSELKQGGTFQINNVDLIGLLRLT